MVPFFLMLVARKNIDLIEKQSRIQLKINPSRYKLKWRLKSVALFQLLSEAYATMRKQAFSLLSLSAAHGSADTINYFNLHVFKWNCVIDEIYWWWVVFRSNQVCIKWWNINYARAHARTHTHNVCVRACVRASAYACVCHRWNYFIWSHLIAATELKLVWFSCFVQTYSLCFTSSIPYFFPITVHIILPFRPHLRPDRSTGVLRHRRQLGPPPVASSI